MGFPVTLVNNHTRFREHYQHRQRRLCYLLCRGNHIICMHTRRIWTAATL